MARRSPDGERAALEHATNEILPRFGFAASEIDNVVRVPQRIKNVNYRVRAGGADWVLKRHNNAHSSERLEYPHAIERGLADRDFPVARLRMTAAGGTVVSDDTGSYTLHSWVDGQQISIDQRDETVLANPELTSELGALIGRLHRLTSAMTLPEKAHTDAQQMLEMPRRAARSAPGQRLRMSRELRLRIRPRKSDFDHWIIEHLPAIYAHAERLATTTIDAGDIVASHHDINWENLVFDDRFRVRALLDFDNATRVHRNLDVGLAAAVLVGPDVERLTTFLAAYTSAAEHQVDRSVVELGIQLKCARSVIWSIDAYLSGRAADDDMLETWCRHMYAGLDGIADSRDQPLSWVYLLPSALGSSEALSVVLAL